MQLLQWLGVSAVLFCGSYAVAHWLVQQVLAAMVEEILQKLQEQELLWIGVEDE